MRQTTMDTMDRRRDSARKSTDGQTADFSMRGTDSQSFFLVVTFDVRRTFILNYQLLFEHIATQNI